MSRTNLWPTIICLTLMSFTLISSEFMPVALLTPIGRELGMTEGQTGQAIAVSGFFAVVTSLFSNTVFARFNRKHVVMFYTVVMIVAGIAVSFAPNAAVFMAGRALIGASIGGFFSLSASIVARIATGKDLIGIFAWIQGGCAVATVIAQPLGSFLGGWIGWRGAFFIVVPCGILALVLQAIALPSVPGGGAMPVGRTMGMLKRKTFSIGMGAMMCFFIGQFALSTYLRPYLEDVTHLSLNSLSLTLFALGLAGLLGTMVIGRVVQWAPYGILIAAPALMAVVALGLIGLGHLAFAVVPLLVVWGFVTAPNPVAWNSWMARTIPDDLEPGGAMLVALIQTSITLAAFAGGLLYDTIGWQGAFLCSSLAFGASALIGNVLRIRAAAPRFARG